MLDTQKAGCLWLAMTDFFSMRFTVGLLYLGLLYSRFYTARLNKVGEYVEYSRVGAPIIYSYWFFMYNKNMTLVDVAFSCYPFSSMPKQRAWYRMRIMQLRSP